MLLRQHTSAYVSIRQHTSGVHSVHQRLPQRLHYAAPSAYVSIRQHTSAYVSIRQHTTAYDSIRQHTSAHVSIHRPVPPARIGSEVHARLLQFRMQVSIRQHTSAYINMHARLLGTGTGLVSAMACFRSATCLRQCSMQVGERRKAAQAQRVHRPTNLHQHTSAYVSVRQHTHIKGSSGSAGPSPHKPTSAYVSVRQRTSAYAY
jgi:hypothetical protein